MSVVFEPQRPRRSGGRLGPAALAATAALVTLALVKPWQSGPSPDLGPVAPASSRPTAPGPTDAGRLALPSPTATPFPPLADIRRAIRAHDAWGVRVLVDGPALPRPPDPTVDLVELWQPAAPPLPDGIASLGDRSSDAVVFDVGDRGVRFIGLTRPADARIRDLRLVVERPLGRLQPVAINVVEVERRGERYAVYGPWNAETWVPGIYHFRIVLPHARTSIAVVIGGAPAD